MNLNEDDSKEPGFAFIDRVLSTSSGWVIVVAMAPWEKLFSHFENRVFIFQEKKHFYRAKAGGKVGDEVVAEETAGKKGLLDLVVET